VSNGKLRVLPLGGLGEIGKNMTVVEYDGAIVLVDVGLRFPTADMMGIDLVLPDFAYLRERAQDIEGIVVTHGHEDHLGALPWVLRELGEENVPAVYGGPLTIAMARSKLDEHKLKRTPLKDVDAGETLDLGPFSVEMVHLTHSIPDSNAVALTSELGTVLVTGDYKFDQTPVDGKPADVSRLAELGGEGVLLLCGDSTNVDRTRRRCSPAVRAESSSPASPPTSTASSRSSTLRGRSGARSRSSGARCARTSTSGASSATSRCRRASWCRRARSTTFPTTSS